MDRGPKYCRKSWRKKAPPTSRHGAGFWVAGVLVAMACVCLVVFHFYSTGKAKLTMQRMLDQMRVEYHLDERQLALISAMEQEFHGTGNPFTRPSRTLDETRQHERAISAVMNPEDAARFLSSIEKKHRDDLLKSLPINH